MGKIHRTCPGEIVDRYCCHPTALPARPQHFLLASRVIGLHTTPALCPAYFHSGSWRLTLHYSLSRCRKSQRFLGSSDVICRLITWPEFPAPDSAEARGTPLRQRDSETAGECGMSPLSAPRVHL
ncbi:hypothetical protein VTK56DRAFT_9037 [Thermocarpiscus australiensis]